MNKVINAEAFEAFLVKALKLTSEEVASLYNEAGEATDFTILESKDAERIKKLSSDKDNQYKRGLKEGALKLEKELKEKYEVESELIGVELFDHIVETKLADVKGADPTEVLKHPEVIKALNEKDKILKAKDKEIADKLKAKEDEINETMLLKEVESFGLAEFDALNPILPADVKKAKTQKEFFLSKFKEGKKFQKTENGFIVKDKDGNPLKDEHGYDISFKDYIKGTAGDIFDFKAAEDRSSAGNKTGTGQSNGNIRKPKDEAEFQSMMKNTNLTPEDRVKIYELHKKN